MFLLDILYRKGEVMSKKYIKGKDGKFRGSLPDMSNVPSLPIVPKLPKIPEPIFAPSEDILIRKRVYPNDIKAYFLVEGSRDISGAVYPNENGTFTAELLATSYGSTDSISETVLASSGEAETYIKNKLNDFAYAIKSFDNKMASPEASEFLKLMSEEKAKEDTWQEQIDSTFGPRTAWMRSAETGMGATVQRYQSGYYIRVHQYKDQWDREGSLILTKAYPDFDTSYYFASYIVLGISNR